MNNERCPECGCSREMLLECAQSDEENRSIAWVIAENCKLCKEWLDERFISVPKCDLS